MKHMGTEIFPAVNCQVKTTLHKKTQIENVYHEAAKDNIQTWGRWSVGEMGKITQRGGAKICSVNLAPNDVIGKVSSVVVVYLKAR